MTTTVLEPMVEFDRLFNTMFSRFLANGNGNGSVRSFVPATDIVVNDDEVLVHFDLPGLDADSLEIELENDVLTVRGERKLPYSADDEQKAWYRIERGFGKFERVLRVPTGLDPDAIDAQLVNGVLTLRIQKPETLKPHRVQIKAGETRQLEAAAA